MKFRVEHDLKNFEKALEMLALCGEEHFAEALEVTKKNRLFKQALTLYEPQPELHSRVKRAFGEYLEQRGYL